MILNKSYKGSIYGNLKEHRKPTFSEVWGDVDSFLEDYNNVGIEPTIGTQAATTLYYLLYANYGNRTIAPDDTTRFKYRLFALIYQYGPTWDRRLGIQSKLRGLTEEELLQGSVQIYNNASNPSTDPTTDSTQLLNYIENQSVTHNQRGKLDAYMYLWGALETDVTKEFLDRFNSLFLKIGERYVEIDYEEIE